MPRASPKTYQALGMRKAGVRLVGPGDITQDTQLQGMGKAAVGVITAHHYHADLATPENQAFVKALGSGLRRQDDAGLRRCRRL